MKDEKIMIAGNGLKLMFIGEIVALFAVVPMVGGLAALAGGIIALVGLIKLRNSDEGYKKALIMLALVVAATIVGSIMAAVAVGGTIMSSGGAVGGGLPGVLVMSLAALVFGFLQTYLVCTTTSGLLRELGRDSEAAQGDLVWKLNAVSYAVSIISAIMTYAAVALASFLGIISGIVALVAGILYIIFLYKSYNAMLA